MINASNCGAGGGKGKKGFQKGNTCGGRKKGLTKSSVPKDKAAVDFFQSKMKAAKSKLETNRKSALNAPEVKRDVAKIERLEKSIIKQKQVYTRTLGLANAQKSLGREAASARLREKSYLELAKLTDLREKQIVLSAKVKFKFMESFEIPVKNRKVLDYDPIGDKTIDSNLRTAFKNLEKYTHPDVHGVRFETVELSKHVKKYYPPKEAAALIQSGRCFISNNKMVLSKNDPPINIIHEFGHLIEDNVPNARKLAQGFLHHRVGDEPLTNLRQRYGDMYGADEVGRKDNFDKVFGERSAHYVGKHYPHGATEVLAKGVEQFFTDPIKFAKKDPEYFNFVIGMMQGDFR